MNENDEILTTKEVAAMLKCKPEHIYQLKARHAIPYHKLGGAIRFIKSEIFEWIKNDANI